MNQLFTIMRRWLWHDKKRTILTLASITLSVFLISFVGVYMNSALNAIHGGFMYEFPAHVSFHPKTIEQTRILDNNVAWESHYTNIEFGGTADWTKKVATEIYKEHSEMFPDITVNGISVYGGSDYGLSAEMRGGDLSLYNEGRDGRRLMTFPEKPHEVVVNTDTAKKFGLEKGGTITIRSVKRSGKLYYGELDENNITIADDDGNIIYHEDTDGSRLAEIYDLYCAPEESQSNMYLWFFPWLYSTDPNKTEEILLNYQSQTYIPMMRAEITGEPQTVCEYTGVVKDICDVSTDLIFSMYDEDILSLMSSDNTDFDIFFCVRVKEDIDAEGAAINAAKGIGLYHDITDPGYELNLDLLLTEGRQLEYLENIAWLFILFVIIMSLFMFLARLIINNAFEISAAYRTEQYGALKTIGASDRQIFSMIMLECAMYMIIAIPVGMGLAIGCGQFILSKIRDIKVFDPIFGEGISESFFTLEFSPLIMGVTLLCAVFSVFFSAYADAMRVRRLPPIRSAGYSTSKRRIKGHDIWLSRRLFGYSFGFAVKSISKQKVRFFVTLISAVLSGIFIMTMGCIAKWYSDSLEKESLYRPYKYDLEIDSYEEKQYNRKKNKKTEISIADRIQPVREKFDILYSSGYFEDVIPTCSIIVPNNDDPSVLAVLSDEFKDLSVSNYGGYLQLTVKIIPRENYEKYIRSDIGYDELASSGKMLLCGTCYDVIGSDQPSRIDPHIKFKYRDRYDDEYNVYDFSVFNTDSISSLSFTGGYPSNQDAEDIDMEEISADEYYSDDESNMNDHLRETNNYTQTIEFSGIYETDNIEYMTDFGNLTAILPMDSVKLDFSTVTAENLQRYRYVKISKSFLLNAKEDMKQKASEFVKANFPENEEYFITDQIAEDTFTDNSVRALKYAGFGFAFALASVVLLNLFSTMSANMINRRRDLSMMRSCGMSMRQVTLSLVTESSFYGIITTVVSSTIGWLLSGLIIQMVRSEEPDIMNIVGRYSFPVGSALALFAVIMSIMAAAYVPALISMSRSRIAQEMRTNV